jgi:thiol:disulfide interchange protein DsbC
MVAVSGTMALSAETLDLDKALRIGTGKTTVIEFTDPDCPYCRKAYQYF